MWRILGPIIVGAVLVVPLMLLFVFSSAPQMEKSAPPPLERADSEKSAARDADDGATAPADETEVAAQRADEADLPEARPQPRPQPQPEKAEGDAETAAAEPGPAAPAKPKIVIAEPPPSPSAPEPEAEPKAERESAAPPEPPKADAANDAAETEAASPEPSTGSSENAVRSGGSSSGGSGFGSRSFRGNDAAMKKRAYRPRSRGLSPGGLPDNANRGELVERSEPREAGEAAEAGETAAPVVGEVKEDWTVVPVFYGTDRQKTMTVHRVTYDWQRGRHLELGRALVTVPKLHEVPMVERPWALKIPYLDITLYQEKEDPKKHFTIKEIKSLSQDDFLRLARERLADSQRFKDHALVFVHGYQTKFDNAVFRTAQIAYDLKFDGAPFLYSWPSGGTLQGYTYDRESAAQAEPFLREFLTLVRDETGAKKMSIIAHSMGNQPLLRVLQDLKRSMPEGVLVSQLILAAPDVDRHSFENIVGSIQGIAEGITLYAASNDAALNISRRVNGGVPRAGDVPDSGPIVIEGVDTIDATATSMDSVGINHSGYAENNALLEDIGKLIGTGMRPPEVRLPALEKVESDTGVYWRYPSR